MFLSLPLSHKLKTTVQSRFKRNKGAYSHPRERKWKEGKNYHEDQSDGTQGKDT